MNLSGLLISANFNNNLEELEIITGKKLKFEKELTFGQIDYISPDHAKNFDFLFFENGTMVITDITIGMTKLTKTNSCKCLLFKISSTAMVFVFDFYEDGNNPWDDYIGFDEEKNKLVSAGHEGINVINFEKYDIETEVFPYLCNNIIGISYFDIPYSKQVFRYSLID